jgi:hypothetical protein
MNPRQLESQSFYDWRFTANQLILATSPLRRTTNNFIFQLNTCGYSPYVTSSLTRGWVCRHISGVKPEHLHRNIFNQDNIYKHIPTSVAFIEDIPVLFVVLTGIT